MIQRERYINKIKPFIGKDVIKVLTGIRRSGKSIMLRLIQEEILRQGVTEAQFISFNFESMENADFCTASSLYQELKRRISSNEGKAYLFFDEIQEVEQWEKCINSVRVDFDCDIYITGSNAKLLSGELATYLGGRYVEFVVFPFSFEEYLESIKQEKEEFYWNLIDIIFTNLDVHAQLERFIAMEEQNRIANEIHDTVIQKLFGVVCSLKVMENKLTNEGNDEFKENIALLKRSIELAMTELRESIYGRRFKDSLHTFIGTMELYMKEAERLHNTKIEMDIDPKSDYMSLAQKIAVYRVSCEAVNNAIRHGNATIVSIMLKVFPNQINLKVEDNGVGFIKKQEGLYEGNGLKNMKNIAGLLKGRLLLDTERKTGMTVELFLPR